MLLGIEPRSCKVCSKGLYRNMTFLRGGWARCTVCDEFVHYSCLARGKVKFLKRRPRVCKTCFSSQERPRRQGTPSPAAGSPTKTAVGS